MGTTKHCAHGRSKATLVKQRDGAATQFPPLTHNRAAVSGDRLLLPVVLSDSIIYPQRVPPHFDPLRPQQSLKQPIRRPYLITRSKLTAITLQRSSCARDLHTFLVNQIRKESLLLYSLRRCTLLCSTIMVFGLFEVIFHSALSVMDVEPVCVCVDFHLHIIFNDSSRICKRKKFGINRLKLVYFAVGIKMFIQICFFFILL